MLNLPFPFMHIFFGSPAPALTPSKKSRFLGVQFRLPNTNLNYNATQEKRTKREENSVLETEAEIELRSYGAKLT